MCLDPLQYCSLLCVMGYSYLYMYCGIVCVGKWLTFACITQMQCVLMERVLRCANASRHVLLLLKNYSCISPWIDTTI